MFMTIFARYIQILQKFKDFRDSVMPNNCVDEEHLVPGTYQSYCCAVHNIIRLFYEDVLNMETEVSKQGNILVFFKLNC